MTRTWKLLSIMLVFVLLLTSFMTSYTNVFADQENENLEEITDNTEGISDKSDTLIQDLQLPSIVSNNQEEPQSITDSVYQENAVPIKSKEQKELLIKYKDLNKADNIKSKLKDRLELSKLDLKKRIKRLKLELVEISDKDDINKVLDELKKDQSVQYAQPNYKLSFSSVPNDQSFSEQWALQNTGQTVNGQAGVAGIDINVINAWNITEGSLSIIVGVPDTGIDITHNDIADNIYVNSDEISGNGIDDDGNGYIDDVNGWDFFNQDNSVFDAVYDDTHGTQIAGIIAAGMNNGGIVGTAPYAKILPLKFINGTYGYTSDVIEAIEYAKAFGVKIMNCSWGGEGENAALKDAMQNSNMLFVCAAGNSGVDLSTSSFYPAAFGLPNTISVAAIDNKGDLASFSNYGSKVDIAAPGVNILSTIPVNSYSLASGTSSAAAYVTGITALLLSYDDNLSPEDVKAKILQNTQSLPQLSGKVNTGGMVKAYEVLMAQLPSPLVSITTPGDGTTIDLNQSVTVSAAGVDCHHMKVFIKGPNDTDYICKDDSYALGNSITYNFTPDVVGSYSIKVKGYDLEDEADPNIKVAEANVSVTVSDAIPDVRPATTITTNYTLTEDVAYQSLTISGATVDLNGYKLYVLGDLIQPGGTLNINNGTLDIKGDYKIQSTSGGSSSGILQMTGTSDKIIVYGNFIADSRVNHSQYLTSGILEVKGNFTQKSSYVTEDCRYNFNATGTHKVLLSGSSLQTIGFEDSDVSAFNTLEVTNTDQGVSCSAPIAIRNLQNDLTVKGDLVIGGNTDIGGKTVIISGNLIQSRGILKINNGILKVEGDYKIQSTSGGHSSGILQMTGALDKVVVGGSFITDSSVDHSQYLISGVLEVKGNFTQKSSWTVSNLNFNATGTHKVLLSGSNLQTISFEDYNYSRFNVLVITKPIDIGYSFNHQPYGYH